LPTRRHVRRCGSLCITTCHLLGVLQ
jgi:hypothetical protein